MGEFWQALVSSTDAYTAVDSLYDLLATIAFYVTLAVLAVLTLYNIVVDKRDEGANSRVKHVSLGVVIGYSVGVISVLGAMKLVLTALDDGINTKFWMMIGLFALVLVGIAVVVYAKKHWSFSKWITFGFAVLLVAYVAVLVLLFPAEKDKYQPLNKVAMYLISVALVAVIALLAWLFDEQKTYDSRALTYAAVCIAASFALSYVKFFSLPQGGSITFASMLPLALYSYMFGLRRGVVAGLVYGLLQFVQSPQYYEPMQALLDYPIAFAAIGVAGIGRKMKFLGGKTVAEFCVGATIAVSLRYVAHFLSGYFVFNSWAAYWGEWYAAHPFVYSAVYNLFLFVELAVLLVIAVVLLQSKSVKRMLRSVEA